MRNEIDSGYLFQIQKYPLLSADDECALAAKIAKGDRKAVNALVNSNLRLVVSIACKFSNCSVNVMDLIQEGNMGLMIAAEKYKTSFNTRFSTYAYPWIFQYMSRYANAKSSFISIPHRKDDMIRRVQNAQSYLFQKNGKEATRKELAAYLNVSESQLKEIMEYCYVVSSLDIDAGDSENSSSIGDFIPDTTYSADGELLRSEEKSYLRMLMTKLPANERKVIWYRYNFDCEHHSKTLREISQILGISPEAVRQAEIRAVKRLKLAAANEVY